MCRLKAATAFDEKPECSFTVELKELYINLWNGQKLDLTVASSQGPSGELVVEPQDLTLWWPYSMSPNGGRDRKPGHLYTLQVIPPMFIVCRGYYDRCFST